MNNKTSNVAGRAELGRLPLNITINHKILDYILYKKPKDEEFSLKQSFLMSFDLYCNGKSSFHSHLMEMSKYFKVPDFNTDLLDTAIVKNFVGLIKQLRIFHIISRLPVNVLINEHLNTSNYYITIHEIYFSLL